LFSIAESEFDQCRLQRLDSVSAPHRNYYFPSSGALLMPVSGNQEAISFAFVIVAVFFFGLPKETC